MRAVLLLLLAGRAEAGGEATVRAALQCRVAPESQMGPLAEAEVGWRNDRDITSAVFVGVGEFEERSLGVPVYNADKGTEIHYWDAGVRGRFHVGSGFFGVGAGYEWRSERMFEEGTMPTSMTTRYDGLLFEVHGGVEAPVGKAHLQVLVTAVAADEMVALRFAIGLRL